MEKSVEIKLKRKEIDDVNGDFFDFSLSSPARKIRRLNAELPPIIEEEEADMQIGYEQWLPKNGVFYDFVYHVKPPVIEELPSVPENEEKAIVLFNPTNDPISYSQGKLSIDPNLISCFKNQAFWGNQLNSIRSSEDDEAMESGINGEDNACKAVIPWVPSPKLNPEPKTHVFETEVLEAMDAEEMEASTMNIEDSNATNIGDINFSRLNEGLPQQWFQQHCMIPQPPENTTTPIVWYR